MCLHSSTVGSLETNMIFGPRRYFLPLRAPVFPSYEYWTESGPRYSSGRMSGWQMATVRTNPENIFPLFMKTRPSCVKTFSLGKMSAQYAAEMSPRGSLQRPQANRLQSATIRRALGLSDVSSL